MLFLVGQTSELVTFDWQALDALHGAVCWPTGSEKFG